MKYLEEGAITRRGSKMLRVEKVEYGCFGCAYYDEKREECTFTTECGDFEETMCSALRRKSGQDIIYREVPHIKHLYGTISADESLNYWFQYKIEAIKGDLAALGGYDDDKNITVQATCALLERYKELQRIFSAVD